MIGMVAQWIALVAIRLVLGFIGLFAVAIALPFSTIHRETARDFSEFPHPNRHWVLETLPKWAWLWSNDRDGARGDKRGWWDNETGDSESFWSRYQWLAIRNPVNNSGFLPFLSCDVTKSVITVLSGSKADDYKTIVKGYQWLKADDGKFSYYHFYYLSDNWYIRMGHKIKLEHNNYHKDPDDPTKALKSWTFRIRRL